MQTRTILLAAVLGLAGCASTVEAPPVPSGTRAQISPIVAWERVLQYRVDDRGRVDFLGLAGDRADLDRYVAHLFENSLRNQPSLYPTKNHVLAYHLNAYNALSMYQVLEAGVPGSVGGLNQLRFLGKKIRLGGEETTLKDLREEIVAGGDPRVLFALNDMTVSAPRLPRRPFKAELLSQQLDLETRFFFSENRNVRLDERDKVIHLSAILDAHEAAFLRVAPSLVAYVNQYRTAKLPSGYKVRFLPYDSRVNARE